MDNFSFKFAGQRGSPYGSAKLQRTPENYKECRKPVDPAALEITPVLIEWLRILPAEIRPKNLVLKFPRVANRLAQVRSHPRILERVLSDYMLDDRGGRAGFPFNVLQEMASLRAYYISLIQENSAS